MNKRELNPPQKRVIKKITQAIKNLVAEHDLALDDFYTYEPGFVNAIGIFGDRGAGKSTLLVELYKCSITNSGYETSEVKDLFEKLHFIPLIDCSILAEINTPSAVVFLRIKHCLEEELQQQNFYKNKAAIDSLLKELDPLIGWCTRIADNYTKLYLELSTTPSDFDYYQQQGINERLQLKQKLGEWLTDVRALIGEKSFVILLDDFDLSPVVQVRAWINALLDELQQVGLVFVVAADFHRLEYLSKDLEKKFDPKTGRALLNKIFPPKHCMHVPAWRIEDILDFSLPQYIQDKEGIKPTKGKDLKTLLLKLFDNKENYPINEISRLLPHLPRGIENLYEQLPFLSPCNDEYTNVLNFSSILASCRDEPLFARTLKESTTRPWSTYFKLNDKALSPEQWRGLIDKAYQRSIWSLNNIQRLIPFDDLLYIGSMEKRKKILANKQAPLLNQSDYPEPLRDARETDHALWVELLLNLDLYSSLRYRVSLLTIWQPFAIRIDNSRFEVPFPSWELRAFFTDNEGILSKATLFWLRAMDDGQISIGWQPFFSGLSGERNPLVTKLIKQLLVDTTGLIGDIPSEHNLQILPNKLWSLLVLVDALERCPWQAFSRLFNWLVVTYIALAAAFVRTAYFYTLTESSYFKEDSQFSEIEKGFLDMLKNRDSSFLFQYSSGDSKTDSVEPLERNVWHCLSELFAQDTHWQKKLKKEESERTLVKATQCYLESTMYQDVVTLLQETREFYSD